MAGPGSVSTVEGSRAAAGTAALAFSGTGSLSVDGSAARSTRVGERDSPGPSELRPVAPLPPGIDRRKPIVRHGQSRPSPVLVGARTILPRTPRAPESVAPRAHEASGLHGFGLDPIAGGLPLRARPTRLARVRHSAASVSPLRARTNPFSPADHSGPRRAAFGSWSIAHRPRSRRVAQFRDPRSHPIRAPITAPGRPWTRSFGPSVFAR